MATPAQFYDHNGELRMDGSLVGGLPAVVTVTAADSPLAAVANTVYLVDSELSDFAVHLPAPVAGTQITVKKIDGREKKVTLTTATGHIDPFLHGGSSQADVVISDFQVCTVVGDGSNWWLVGQPGFATYNHSVQHLAPPGGYAVVSDTVAANNSGSGLTWVAGAADGDQVLYIFLGVNGDTAAQFGPGAAKINLPSLPTSSAGLAAGDLYNDTGTIKVKL